MYCIFFTKVFIAFHKTLSFLLPKPYTFDANIFSSRFLRENRHTTSLPFVVLVVSS